jgi:hypothetical protein
MRMRVEIMGSPNCRIVGESQAVLVLLDPMISTRPRIGRTCASCVATPGDLSAEPKATTEVSRMSAGVACTRPRARGVCSAARRGHLRAKDRACY